MIVFNKNLLHNTFLVDEGATLNQGGFISDDDLSKIKSSSESLKTSRFFLLRIGFFLLGTILVFSIMGLLAWMVLMNNSGDGALIFLFLMYSVIGVFACEFISKQHFRYGLDDAFILATLGSICAFVVNFIDANFRSEDEYSLHFDNYLIYIYITLAITGLVACLRYCHWISGLISIIGTIGAFFYFMMQIPFAIQILSFIMMAFAFGLYFLSLKLNNINTNYHYLDSILTLKVVSLILFYVAGNYLVVRVLSEDFLGITIEEGSDISLSYFFWAFTFIVPVFYLYWAIIKKDKTFLNIGFITFCFSIFTFRTFHSVLPAEVAMTLAGIIVFAITYFLIKKLKNNEIGITFKPDRNSNSNNLVNLEAAIINSQVNLAPQDEGPMDFGGGGFSGGGASEGF